MTDDRVIYCNAAAGSLTVSSNIFATNTTAPIVGDAPCPPRHSLFDVAGAVAAARGPGNQASDAASFFVNRSLQDFRLSATSPARGLGEDGLVTTDAKGGARPLPAGTAPDVGAFETAE